MEGYSRFQKICAIFALISVCLLSLHCKAQVTFSRDWNAGKRAADSPDLQASIKSATALCHLLMTQIRQVATCGTTFDDAEEDSAPPSYTETR
ncbi:Adipokinetic hormone [Popillia japonica]|uniref:Adipokinetic hormone n=1 Tax=Popillia japonica TaxID=7064 RepID=A0AAW1N777_POPJA